MPQLHSVVEASTRLKGGERITVGGREWEVLHTPGHSLGHVCLASAEEHVVFPGDHLLPRVTPPVTPGTAVSPSRARTAPPAQRERPCRPAVHDGGWSAGRRVDRPVVPGFRHAEG